VRQRWFSVGIFPLVPFFGLTGNHPQSASKFILNVRHNYTTEPTIMEIIRKWKEIVNWQRNNSQEQIGDFAEPITEEQFSVLEKLLEEFLPLEFKMLYQFSNGQTESGNGMLFGERFISSDEIIRQLEFSRTLIKPENKSIENPEKSGNLINKIVEFYISKAPRHKLFGLQKSWYKIEFKCGVGSYSGPYLYASKGTTSKERGIIKISDYEPISGIIKELHILEEKSYNWDELNFVIFADGTFKVERTNYNFDQDIAFTSTPENAIKKKYFHFKWLPIFSDFGGNYIGIDLDPDVKGKKGQIIIFGRDEEKMVVIADNLELFFDFILNEINKNNAEALMTESHLHDTIREIINNNCA